MTMNESGPTFTDYANMAREHIGYAWAAADDRKWHETRKLLEMAIDEINEVCPPNPKIKIDLSVLER